MSHGCVAEDALAEAVSRALQGQNVFLILLPPLGTNRRNTNKNRDIERAKIMSFLERGVINPVQKCISPITNTMTTL